MYPKKLLFATGNKCKFDEAKTILSKLLDQIELQVKAVKLTELQTDDAIVLVKDKALKAYDQCRQLLFVEHTGLYINKLKGLPGGLTQCFWDALGPEEFSNLYGNIDECQAEAKTFLCYVDGYQFYVFEGSIGGKLINEPKGDKTFQWDCVFVPNGYNKTFAELGQDKKNEISMRRAALEKFAKFLKEAYD